MEEERRRDGKEEGGGEGGPPTMLSGRKVANSPFSHIHQNQTTTFPTLPHIHQPSCCGRLDLKVPLASKNSWNN